MTRPLEPSRSTSSRGAFVASALSLAVGAAGYASSVLFSTGDDLGTVSQTPLVAVSNAVSAVAAIALAVQLPTVTWFAGPRWAVAATAVGLAFLGAFAFAMLTVVPHFGLVVDDGSVFAAESPWQDALGWPKQLLLLLGPVALAIAGLRRHTLGVFAAVGLIVAGLLNAVLWPYAPGAIGIGIVLALIAATRPGTGDGALRS